MFPIKVDVVDASGAELSATAYLFADGDRVNGDPCSDYLLDCTVVFALIPGNYERYDDEGHLFHETTLEMSLFVAAPGHQEVEVAVEISSDECGLLGSRTYQVALNGDAEPAVDLVEERPRC